MPGFSAVNSKWKDFIEQHFGFYHSINVCFSFVFFQDLVKSHLMFAVREEVEVLKEQIADLIERNNQLEYENGILRAAASAETLAKLQQPRQQPPSSSSSWDY